MDLIKELHFVLKQQTDFNLNKILPPGSKILALCQLIVEQGIDSDELAAKMLYQTSKPDKKYLMLKRSLVVKLSDQVFKQPQNELLGTHYENIRIIVNKELLIAEKLLSENVYHNPTKIIAKVEQIAAQYFLIDLQLEAAIKFRSVYALKGFPNETREYNSKIENLLQLNQYLITAQGYWEMLYSQTKFFMGKTRELTEQCKLYSQNINQWLQIQFSPFLKLNQIRIGLVEHYQTYHFSHIEILLQEYRQLIHDYPFLASKHVLLDLYYQQALYYRHLKKLDTALELLHKCLPLTDYQAFNRFLIQEILFDIAIKKGNYSGALKLILEVIQVPEFQFLDAYDKSAWKIREALLYFIFWAQNDTLLLNQLPNYDPVFDLNRFLEQTRKSAKDKYGYNAMLLLIRLMLILIKNPKRVDYEGNNLSIYFHRYLKDIPDQRTGIFFKTLSKIASQNFAPNQLKLTEVKLFEELNVHDAYYDSLEIIPYPAFWQFILQVLKKQELQHP